ncbi:MAG: hypothetical protein Q8M17_13625 [Actinomycetota bacterium]|nr:hypothetical protein [Actinomycetota bacterium]
MTGPFATAIIVVSLVLALWAVVLLVANRPPGKALFAGVAVLEAMLLAFLVGGIVQMAGEERDFARLEFVGYLVGMAAIPPAAAWWVKDERSRAAAGVLAVVLLVMPILVIRVQQVWAGTSG